MGRLRIGWVSAGCCVGLVGCVVVGWGVSWRWPLVGDASLMHYVVFLLRGGMAPYKDVVDVNLPGAYFFESLGMRLFGDGAVGWRVYDAVVMGSLLGACVLLGRRLSGWTAGVSAGALLWLVHLQDGIFDVGQRDLVMAGLLLWGYVALFAALSGERRGGGWRIWIWMFLFGLAMGTGGTIKPVLLPLALVLLGMTVGSLRGKVIAGALGMGVPFAVALIWLVRYGAVGAFWKVARGLIALHAELGRQGVGYLLLHSLAPVWVLVLVWFVVLAVKRPAWTRERVLLGVGVLGAWVAYVGQGKGFPYQRYPLLAVLLVLVFTDLEVALRGRQVVRWVAVAGCFAALVLGGKFAYAVTTFSPATPFQLALAGESAGARDGEVQCLDTFGGCVGVLYERRLVQHSGLLYDCYLFGEASAARDAYRAEFAKAWGAGVVVLTDQDCFGGKRGFGRVAAWPWLAGALERDYVVRAEWRSRVLQKWWSRRDEPTGYRIYVRR